MDELVEPGGSLLPPIPPDEAERLAALWRTGLLDSPPAECFDRITRSVAALLRAPMAAVSLLDRDRQWFLSRVGLPLAQTPRDIAFSSHAVAERRLLRVCDARLDSRFAHNPLVTGEPHVRAYLAVPLLDAAGHALGTLCVLDREPREFGNEEQQLLQRYGKALERLIRG